MQSPPYFYFSPSIIIGKNKTEMGMWLEDFMGKDHMEEWARRKYRIKINLIFVDVTDFVYLEYCPMISFQVQHYQELIY
jgi:hypothetical protein